jgi:hypothetical protein
LDSRIGGLLVVTATVKGFGRPLRVLIDSGASTYYARKETIAENASLFQAASEAARDTISVRLATGVVVTTKRIVVDLRVKFEDFDFTEKFTVLDMDERYDLILGMAWLQEYEPWIDWKSKSVASSSLGVNHTFGSHDPTVVAHRRGKLARSKEHHVGVGDVVAGEPLSEQDDTLSSVQVVYDEVAVSPPPGSPCGRST